MMMDWDDRYEKKKEIMEHELNDNTVIQLSETYTQSFFRICTFDILVDIIMHQYDMIRIHSLQDTIRLQYPLR